MLMYVGDRVVPKVETDRGTVVRGQRENRDPSLLQNNQDQRPT